MRRLLPVLFLLLAACGYGVEAAETAPPAAAPTTSSSTTTTSTTTTTASTLPPTTTSTTTTTTTVPPAQELVIHGVGDVALDPAYIPALVSTPGGYHWAWSGLELLFWDSLTVINLECPISNEGTVVPKSFNFRCDPEALDEAKFAGVDVANQANNHVLDFGTAALLDSIVQLEAAGIGSVGSGANAEEAYRPRLIERNGWTVAVLGFGGVIPGDSWLASDDRPGMASGDDTEAMVAAVAAADEVADFVVVTIHWGMELDTSPRADDMARAKALVEAGADVIFGHHQHRLGPMSWYQGKPIFWGLGNFVWPRLSLPSADTAVAEVRISADGEIVEACMIPATIVSSGHPTLDNPYRGCEGVESPTLTLDD
ncbi:MAG: CapA family protein [Acidimicrobiia bacterium]|nr:MAG: CapA family protein [Acidimicrobiia bacterium]